MCLGESSQKAGRSLETYTRKYREVAYADSLGRRKATFREVIKNSSTQSSKLINEGFM
jgi:hypothetical protein